MTQKTIVSVTPLSIAADSRTYKIAASFARFGYRSIVIEGQPSDSDPLNLPFELRSVMPGRQKQWPKQGNGGHEIVPWYRIPDALKIPGRYVKALMRYSQDYGTRVLRALPPASLYYLHGPYQFPGVYAVARRYKAPIIYDAHDFYTMDDQTPFLQWVESWCIRGAESVVTVSPGVSGLLSGRYGCHPIVIRNVHDCRLDKQPAKGLRESLGLDAEQFLLVCVGQAKSGQHIAGLLKALAILPASVHLAFVGQNTNQYRQQAVELGVEARVHLIPPVKPEEVVPFIQSANAAVILYFPLSLNYEYCLPNRLFQAIAASLPLLYPDLTEIKALAERSGLGILIDPFSAESIKSAVLDLLENPARLNAYRSAAQIAAVKFSWEKEEILLKELVSKILSLNLSEN